ncbi:hypothetical protein [Haloarcula pellucida]|uniref:Uncharacterized protein n=1 Tax=Haloarcula pellucida TaxID=1427151 RepID=A0A830GSU9_9EURY|nr:hypothetical protein [Halomicroarcula pellucida]MBX0350478.1 hypothetical protein [Halomicroarcula pellucida]GGO03520.1 hypothetical protein GCM10009030_39240 [Halomicroarcula pellucida]
MVSDDVDVVEAKANRDAVEAAIQTWLDNNSAATSLDHVAPVYEKRDRIGLAMVHTD